MALLDQIFAAGVVGCGGAGFPTHAKLKGEIHHYIINGAECEPLLETDRYLMRHKAREIVAAAAAVAKEVGAGACTIALKSHYNPEIAALEAAIATQGVPVTLHLMENIYPAGDEQVMVESVTGRVVPPGGIPLDVGVAVNNIATMVAVHDAMAGVPLAWKYLTVAGEVASPVILHLPVGTTIAQCLALAGGVTTPDPVVVLGGPMMGAAVPLQDIADQVVTKTTSGLVVLPGDSYLAGVGKISLQHMVNRARSACIQCSYCTQMCPRYLLGHPLEPHKIMRKLSSKEDITALLDEEDIRQAAICCECGICELYACPMELQPRRVNMILKEELRKAGISYQKGELGLTPRTDWAYRKIPAGRAAGRVGVGSYGGQLLDRLVEHTPRELRLPLKQHIGAPAQPVVTVGQRVQAGELIARCPQGLGANLHTGVAGVVRWVQDSIIIETEG